MPDRDILEDFFFHSDDGDVRLVALSDATGLDDLDMSFLRLGVGGTVPARYQTISQPVVIRNALPYVGQLPGMGTLFVQTHRGGWVIDDDLEAGKVTLAVAAPMSQHEMRQAMHLRNEQGNRPEVVTCYYKSAAGLENLPLQHQPSYLTAGFDTLLLVYARIAGAKRRLLDLSVLLPRERPQLLDQCLRRLRDRRLLLDTPTGPNQSGGDLLHSNLWLTDLGEDVLTITKDRALQSIHAKSLVAQLLPAVRDGNISWLSGSPAVADAILSLATIIETNDHMTLIEVIVVDVAEEYAEVGFEGRTTGIAAELYRRGPVWLAVLLWHRMRQDESWRPVDRAVCTHKDFAGKFVRWVSNNKIAIDRMASFGWDDIWDRLRRYGGELVPKQNDDLRLDEEELHSVEKAVVRAFLHNLAWVHMPKRTVDFAYDLAAKRALQLPRQTQLHQLSPDHC